MKYITFLLYTIAWQGFVWGAFWVAVMERGHSGWWLLLAILLSGCQYPPQRWAQIDE